MNKYKVCIIGCGDIGFLFDYDKKIEGALTHFKAFSDSENFEVCAVGEKKNEIRCLIKDNYKTAVYDDYEKMCEEIKPDVIVIASNDESHFEMLNKVLKYKPKLVFCEKPLALKFEEVKKISELYDKAKVPLQVNFTRRFLDEFKDIDDIVRNKKIGEIESATFYYSRGLIHNASHYLDLVLWYFGPPENVLSISSKEGISKEDNTVSFNLSYAKGPEIRFIGLNPTKLSFGEIDFAGTAGRVKVNYKSEVERYKVIENKMFKGYSSYEMYECKEIQFTKALPNAVENIYRALKNNDDLKSPANNSLKIFELINRIKEKPSWQN
ncbi:MAG: Gfo/Idh/MocA family oxidoreductase [Bacteroidota bacterium]|nr:Gfo/Idh/MocA family oxidoreductase [Bacteroidota bacterium]